MHSCLRTDCCCRLEVWLTDRLAGGLQVLSLIECYSITIRECKPSSEVRPLIEAARKTFLEAMADIKHGMMIGADKNLFVEPVIWTVEYVQRNKYGYPQTTSN